MNLIIGCVLVVAASPNFEVCVYPDGKVTHTRQIDSQSVDFWAQVAKDCAMWTKYQNYSPFWFEGLPVQYHCTNQTGGDDE